MGGGGGGGKTAPAYEPVKPAEQTMKEASSATSRAQQLRRGIASTFSRPSMGGGSKPVGSATGGTAAKLGA
jgi:hypothetical protein